MSKQKQYAVVRGVKPGVYDAWFGAKGAEVQIKGFAGALYKSFPSRAEAEAWFAEMSGRPSPGQQSMALAFDPQQIIEKNGTQRAKPAAKKEHREHLSGASSEKNIIFSDGGCSKNPGPGGYGVVMMLGGKRKELSGGFARTTNNRMELTACIVGLEALEGPCSITVCSDSQYVVNGIMKGWAKRWKSNNWMRNRDEAAENSDLWSRLLDLCEKHDVRFEWVRGHSGHPENERCDELAVEMTHRANLPPDHGYGKK